MLDLSTYIDTKEPAYLQLFNQSINVPIGDNLARTELLGKGDEAAIENYFIMGRNRQEDIPDMIWLFRTFRYSFMKEPIRIWTDAEPLINQLLEIGNTMQNKIQNNSLTEEQKIMALKRTIIISSELYQRESEFSKVLGEEARKINQYLLLVNVLCILIMLGSITAYGIMMINRLTASNNKTESKNNELIAANKELDTFVYSVSHDLRSPISSIMGIIGIIKQEDRMPVIKDFAGMLEEVVNQQDLFIVEIIDFFKSKRSSLVYTRFSLKSLIEEVLNNNRFAPLARNISITQQIDIDEVYSDRLRLKIILNNLISNAIKYSDERKPDRKMFISGHKQNNYLVIEIEDNGIGIETKHLKDIFKLFYIVSQKKTATGLGLYILLQNIEKLGGTIDVQSEINTGTKFMIRLPYPDTKKLPEENLIGEKTSV